MVRGAARIVAPGWLLINEDNDLNPRNPREFPPQQKPQIGLVNSAGLSEDFLVWPVANVSIR